MFETEAHMEAVQRDVNAVAEGLADGTLDCIATDHAPHTDTEKGLF